MNLILDSLLNQGLDLVAKDISGSYGVETVFFETDLTRLDAPQQLFNYTQAEGLDVDVLINNAGVVGASYF